MSLVYNLKMDIALYEAKLEALEKAMLSRAWSELPEDQKAARLRAKGYLESYLAEAKEDLKELDAKA